MPTSHRQEVCLTLGLSHISHTEKRDGNAVPRNGEKLTWDGLETEIANFQGHEPQRVRTDFPSSPRSEDILKSSFGDACEARQMTPV